jgi:disintegrin and metalloproteinase domain-containing protein 10
MHGSSYLSITFLLQVCQSGECKSSICVKYGLESCFLTSDVVQDKRELCELACRRPGTSTNHTCTSTTELVAMGLIRDLEEGLSLRPGSPCDNFQGYCDVFLKCRKVDAEGPLVRLKKFFFNQENLLTIAQWVTVSNLSGISSSVVDFFVGQIFLTPFSFFPS